MASLAIPGKFSIIEMDGAEIAEVRDIGEVGLVREMLDATYHSTSIFRERIPGLVEVVDIQLELNFITSQYILFDAAWRSGDLHSFVLRVVHDADLPTNHDSLSYDAYIASNTVMTQLEDVVLTNVNLAVSGDIVYTPAPAPVGP